MLDVQNPEIDVDQLMQRIQDKVRQRREAAPTEQLPALAADPAPDAAMKLNQLIAQARDFGQVGVNVPPMFRTAGLKRLVAAPIAKLFLRLAQLITRDQRAYNDTLLAVIAALQERMAQDAARAEQAAAQVSREVAAARADLDGKIAHVARDLFESNAHLGPLSRRIDELDGRSSGAARELAARLDQLRTALSLQERRLSIILEQSRRSLPPAAPQQPALAAEAAGIDDAHYLSFEDAFRGSRDEIKRRVTIYVERLRGAGGPVVDLGCGRGELLEVLRDAGVKASGVDSNQGSVDQCRQLGLDVAKGDLFETLARTPDGALGGLVALHVVEHLPFPLVIRLVDEALRVLRPGGVFILETPNPQNVLVGATTFYLDPTHRNPVHPQTLHFLFEARGLVQVENLLLHPYPDHMKLPEGSPAAKVINAAFYGPQDFATIGRRP